MNSLGYREIGRFLAGEINREPAIELYKQATRQYARKQLSWFRRDTRIHWLEASSTTIVDTVLHTLRSESLDQQVQLTK
jgi:tRNA dimethylallyltransferase